MYVVESGQVLNFTANPLHIKTFDHLFFSRNFAMHVLALHTCRPLVCTVQEEVCPRSFRPEVFVTTFSISLHTNITAQILNRSNSNLSQTITMNNVGRIEVVIIIIKITEIHMLIVVD